MVSAKGWTPASLRDCSLARRYRIRVCRVAGRYLPLDDMHRAGLRDFACTVSGHVSVARCPAITLEGRTHTLGRPSPDLRLFRSASKPQMRNSATPLPWRRSRSAQVVGYPGTCRGPAGEFSGSPLEAPAGR